MPVTYDLDRESGLIRTRCVGDVSFDEVLRHFQELSSDPALPKRIDVLLDLTESATSPNTAQVQKIANEIESLKSNVEWGACAILADRDVLFGMSRMFQVFAESYFSESSVFRERAEAEEWLASERSSPV